MREQVIAKRKDGNRSEKCRRIKRKAGKEEGSIVKKEDKRDERKNEDLLEGSGEKGRKEGKKGNEGVNEG